MCRLTSSHPGGPWPSHQPLTPSTSHCTTGDFQWDHQNLVSFPSGLVHEAVVPLWSESITENKPEHGEVAAAWHWRREHVRLLWFSRLKVWTLNRMFTFCVFMSQRSREVRRNRAVLQMITDLFLSAGIVLSMESCAQSAHSGSLPLYLCMTEWERWTSGCDCVGFCCQLVPVCLCMQRGVRRGLMEVSTKGFSGCAVQRAVTSPIRCGEFVSPGGGGGGGTVPRRCSIVRPSGGGGGVGVAPCAICQKIERL